MELILNCKVLDGYPHYLVLEEVPPTFSDTEIYQAIREVQRIFKTKNYHSVSIVLAEEQFTEFLIGKLRADKYNKIGTNVYYGYNLKQLPDHRPYFELKNLHELPEDYFMELWDLARKDSLNASERTGINELFQGLIKELGPQYRSYCHVGFHKNKPIGITIPHQEPGTTDEGRIFYFGIFPEYRGQGFGARLHLDSLGILKRLKMKTYIGSTGEHNIPMQKIFEQNNCEPFEKRTTYRKVNEG